MESEIVNAELKALIISEFLYLMSRLELGYSDNYYELMTKILFVELGLHDDRLYEYLINN